MHTANFDGLASFYDNLNTVPLRQQFGESNASCEDLCALCAQFSYSLTFLLTTCTCCPIDVSCATPPRDTRH